MAACFSENLGSQSIPLIDKYYREHPENSRVPVADAIVSALTAKGRPCEGKGLPK
jgi:hypothetical protein